MKVFDLELQDSCYYIKRSSIVEQITFDNRTFYAKFECINEPFTPLLLQQHLQRDYTIAVPLLKNGTTNYLVIEYKGEEYQRFHHLVLHLFNTLDIREFSIFEGKTQERIQVFIKVDHFTLEEAEEALKKFSNALQQKLTKKWKCLPDISLPKAYNIITLPYKKLF